MKPHRFLPILALLLSTAAMARVEFTADAVIPSDAEFPEMHQNSNIVFQDPAGLSGLDDGRLIESVGFTRYEKRTYSIAGSGALSIEVAALRDFRAAYSLLTLLRTASVQAGPPGDAFTLGTDGFRFAQGKEWVRIQAPGVREDLLKRIALSVSHRIGQSGQNVPSLVARVPKLGLDPSSLRYFPGLKAFEAYSKIKGGWITKLDADMEIVQARYTLEDRAGGLSLLAFPTTQVAEECFESLPSLATGEKSGGATYAKRIGPLVALLDGDLDPNAADRILSSIRHHYSVRWIMEKKPTTIWGVPVGILGTVIKSLVFVVMLCVVSIVAGAGWALFRLAIRRRASDNILDRQSEITQLRLR
jgi:hypothetical protein